MACKIQRGKWKEQPFVSTEWSSEIGRGWFLTPWFACWFQDGKII